MGIRVEYGPSAVAVGELAYRTGQNQYRKERRSQLEKLAMQQAEMRQRSQMQQVGIMADLQGQQMREQEQCSVYRCSTRWVRKTNRISLLTS